MSLASDFVSLFSNTTNSYKYLFIRSVLERVSQGDTVISIDDIVLDCLTLAWYPSQYFKLSFGSQDQIGNLFTEKNFEYSYTVPITSSKFKPELRKNLSRAFNVAELAKLKKYVPFRVLHPFFDDELRGKSDAVKNREIREQAALQYETRKPFYCFDKELKNLLIHPKWIGFIQSHSPLLIEFQEMKWVEYLQKRNPNVPAIVFKTSPPIKRDSLKQQNAYWKGFIESKTAVRCIYSNKILSPDSISLDHFLPWSYVCHDRIWNLTPTFKEINSSKNNFLPSLDEYLELFLNLQVEALEHNAKHYDSFKNKIAPEMIIDHGFENFEELMERTAFRNRLKSTIINQHHIATQLGFSRNWKLDN